MTWLYARLVALYPRGFRDRFGRAMVDDFRDLVETEGPLRAWTRALADLARSLPREWFRRLDPRARLRWLARDLRFAVRGLGRDPAFFGTSTTVLGLGIGAGTVVLGIVSAYLLRPLPYPAAERLVEVRPVLPLPPETTEGVFDIPLTWDLDAFTLVDGDRPRMVRGAWVSPGYLEAFGMRPALGRAFRPDEAGEGRASVAILSHRLWSERYGADPAILGRAIPAFTSDRPDDAETFTIVGVLPEGYWFHNRYVEFLAPLRVPNPVYSGRLREGVGLREAEIALTALAAERVPPGRIEGPVTLTPLQESYTGRVRPTLVLLSAAVALVLLIACGNVAVLLLVRVHRRGAELGVRRALGATRAALASQLAAEGLVLALAGGLIGAAVAGLSLELLGSVVQERLGLPVPGGPAALRLDRWVLGGLVAASALAGVVFGLVPLIGAGRGRLPGAGGRGRRTGGRLQAWLTAGELALSLSLLVAAGLAVQSAQNVASFDPGFQPRGLHGSEVTLRRGTYPDPADRYAFFDRLVAATLALPGVEEASAGLRIPFLWGFNPDPVEAEGRPATSRESAPEAVGHVVGPHYLDVMRIPLLSGRSIESGDVAGGEPVVVVSGSLAARLWPGEEPLGRRMRDLPRPGADPEQEPGEWRTVVGVVDEVAMSVDDDDLPDYYVPAAQVTPASMTVLFRTREGAPPPVAELADAVAELDPEVAIRDVTPLEEAVEEATAPYRFLAILLTSFGAFAVLLAVLGLYGTVSYAVARSRRDVAVRMAVGAEGPAVAAAFLRDRLGVLLAGLVVGLAGARWLAGLLAAQLQGVSPTEPAVYASLAALLGAVALLAVWVPARKAAHTDPMRVLREE